MTTENNIKFDQFSLDIRDFEPGATYFAIADASRGGRCVMNGMFIAAWTTKGDARAALQRCGQESNPNYTVVKCRKPEVPTMSAKRKAFVVRIDDRSGNRPYYVQTLDSSYLAMMPIPSEETAFRKNLVTLIRKLEIGDNLRVQKGQITVHVDVRDATPRRCPICGRDTEHASAATCGRDECFEANVRRQAKAKEAGQ